MRLLIGFMFCVALPAQSWIGAGVSVPTTGKAIQSASSWVAGAFQVSKSADLWSYSSYSSQFVAGKLTTKVESGAAAHLRDYGRLSLYAIGTLCVTQTTSIGGFCASGGALVKLRLGKSLGLIGAYERASGQNGQVWIGIGGSW